MNIFYKNLTFSTGIRCKINDSLVNLIAKLDGPQKLAPIDLNYESVQRVPRRQAKMK